MPKPPGNTASAATTDQEVHLAQREIVEAEREVGRDIGVGRLFVRQHDVEPDRLGPASLAPLLAASMIEGPPPEQTTNWRLPSSMIAFSLTSRASL